MKRLMLASVTLLALIRMDAALAADVPPAVIYPAGAPPGVIYPTAAPPFTFTGFYVGGTVGGALGSSNYSEAPSGTSGSALLCPKSNPECNPMPPAETVVSAGSNIATVGTSSTAPWGVIGGADVGYNLQIGHFVLGFETDFSGWDLSSSAGVTGAGYPALPLNSQQPSGTTCPNNANLKFPHCPPAVPGTAFTSTTSTSSNWLFTARPRLGFANGNQLLYDVVFGRHLAFDVGDVIGDRGEAALDGREDAVERRLALLVDPAEVGAEDQEPRRAVAYPLPARGVDRRHLGHLAMVRSSGWLYLGKGSSRHGPCRHAA
jgi:opacity protein-like surface antigen